MPVTETMRQTAGHLKDVLGHLGRRLEMSEDVFADILGHFPAKPTDIAAARYEANGALVVEDLVDELLASWRPLAVAGRPLAAGPALLLVDQRTLSG